MILGLSRAGADPLGTRALWLPATVPLTVRVVLGFASPAGEPLKGVAVRAVPVGVLGVSGVLVAGAAVEATSGADGVAVLDLARTGSLGRYGITGDFGGVRVFAREMEVPAVGAGVGSVSGWRAH